MEGNTIFQLTNNKPECLENLEPHSLNDSNKRKHRKRNQLTDEENEAWKRELLKRRTCEICNIVFSIPKGLINHMRVKHTHEKPYTCEICGEQFAVQSTYALHKRRHLGIKPHLCNVCGKTFLRHTDLKIHMYKHNEEKDIQCDLCPKTYHSPLSLKKHKLIVHTDPGEWKHQCQICGKKYASTTTLSVHIKQHNEDRSFKCPVCGKGFYTNQNMKVHIRTHSDFTNFNCHLCTNGYRSNEALQRHLLKLHNIGEVKLPSPPKYFCSECGEGFLQKARLEKHEQLHKTGEKEFPYECNICSKKYKDKQFFLTHIQSKHKTEVIDGHEKSSKIIRCASSSLFEDYGNISMQNDLDRCSDMNLCL